MYVNAAPNLYEVVSHNEAVRSGFALKLYVRMPRTNVVCYAETVRADVAPRLYERMAVACPGRVRELG